MRILVVSDFEEPDLVNAGDLKSLGPVDAVVSCGDLPPEYLIRLSRAFDLPVHYVRGNHDIRYRSERLAGAVDLHGRITLLGNLRVLGLEGSKWYNGGPVQYTEREMRRILQKLRPKLWWTRGVDLVVAHAPPRGIGDAEDPCHQGFECFLWLMRKYRPRFFVHGHVHRRFERPSDRVSRVGGTQVINACGYYLLHVGNNETDMETTGFLEEAGTQAFWRRVFSRPSMRR